MASSRVVCVVMTSMAVMAVAGPSGASTVEDEKTVLNVGISLLQSKTQLSRAGMAPPKEDVGSLLEEVPQAELLEEIEEPAAESTVRPLPTAAVLAEGSQKGGSRRRRRTAPSLPKQAASPMRNPEAAALGGVLGGRGLATPMAAVSGREEGIPPFSRLQTATKISKAMPPPEDEEDTFAEELPLV